MEEGESGLILKPSCLHIAKAWFLPACEPLEAVDQNDLFLEQAKGYVKAVEKSTSPIFSLREVFDPCT